jgi:transcription initiation factor TFIID subunit 2
VAFEALLLTKWFSRKSLARYIFAIISNDCSRIVRRFVARAAIASLGILEAVGDIRAGPKEGEKSVLIEEDGFNALNSKQSKRGDAEAALKAIRKDAGKQKGIREIFIPTFL